MNKKERFAPPAIGGSSLLVIFAILCLTVFALLSLSTVQANSRLADASAEAISNYYAADCQAEAILARIRAGELPEGVWVDGDIYEYVCPISDTQELNVQVQLDGDAWTVLSWCAVSTAEWEAEESLDLWDGIPLI